MKFDGMNFRRRNDLGFRLAREGELTSTGERIPVNYVVFFRVKHAKTVVKANGRVYYDPNSVASDKLLPLHGHSLTSMAYGVTRRRGYELLTTVYLAHDGRVYSALLRRPVFSSDLDKS